jgi:hypothetical protein
MLVEGRRIEGLRPKLSCRGKLNLSVVMRIYMRERRASETAKKKETLVDHGTLPKFDKKVTDRLTCVKIVLSFQSGRMCFVHYADCPFTKTDPFLKSNPIEQSLKNRYLEIRGRLV